MKLSSVAFCLVLVACGSEKDKDSEEKASTGDVEFSGYVQKAFTIRVNGVEFSDSEDFYSRFIDELVKPSYPDLTDDQVNLEGKYGLDEFGSQSKVYMSSMSSEGHLYEGRTDAQSKFTVKVQQKALDETFKARVVVRIGLEVAEVGGSSLRYCYLLHGNKEGVAISDSAKPIIFEEFATQLTKYRCEDVNEDSLVIPGIEGSSKTAKATVSSTVNIASALLASWQGENALAAVAITSTGELLVAKKAVKRADDGKWCVPTLRLASISAPNGTEDCVGDHDEAPASVTSIALQGSDLVLSPDSEKHHLVIASAGQLYSTNGLELCGYPATNCKQAPASNRCDLGYPQTATWHGGALLFANGVNSQGAGYCGANAIHVLSSDLAYMKKYEISVDGFANAKLASDGTSLYLVSLANDRISVSKLALSEE